MADERPPFVVLETTMGPITIELYWNEAPKTCKNFAELVCTDYHLSTLDLVLRCSKARGATLILKWHNGAIENYLTHN